MESLRRKLKWLMAIRVAVVSVTLGVSIYFQIGKSAQSIPAYYSLIIATYLLTILYALLINRVQDVSSFASWQIGVDILFESVLVAITGGVESPFSPLYIISITAASALISGKGGLAAAAVSGILYGGIVDLQYYRHFYHFLPGLTWLPGTELPTPEIFYNLSINLLGFMMVGYLSGTLAQKLESTGERLEAKARDLTGLQEFHRCVLESIDSGVFTTDPEGRITSFNRKAEKTMGYTEPEARGHFWWEVFGWAAPVDELRVESTERQSRFEEKGRRRNGSQLIIGMSLSPLEQRGKRMGVVGVFRDITPLKKMEEAVRRKHWLATIGEMSAGMAHEVRNPLAALSGAMQVLRKDLQPADANRSLLELALRETERLNGIVTGFLQYARPHPLDLKSADVSEVVEETIRMLEQMREYAKTIRFVRRYDPDGVPALLDRDQIHQVCWNLGLNACQAMPVGGTLTVATRRMPVSPGSERESVEIVFEDTGEGIPPEYQEKLFYPFFTTKEGGTGLGLSVVHRIMDEHRGSVHIDSLPGQGTRVRLVLPAGQQAEQATS
jgi:two-component system sensor histidine kinase PilS (NtrC family)